MKQKHSVQHWWKRVKCLQLQQKIWMLSLLVPQLFFVIWQLANRSMCLYMPPVTYLIPRLSPLCNNTVYALWPSAFCTGCNAHEDAMIILLVVYLNFLRKLPIREIHLDNLLDELGLTQTQVHQFLWLNKFYYFFLHSSLIFVYYWVVIIVTQLKVVFRAYIYVPTRMYCVSHCTCWSTLYTFNAAHRCRTS